MISLKRFNIAYYRTILSCIKVLFKIHIILYMRKNAKVVDISSIDIFCIKPIKMQNGGQLHQ